MLGRTDPADERGAVHVGQQQVEQHKTELIVSHEVKGFITAFGDIDPNCFGSPSSLIAAA